MANLKGFGKMKQSNPEKNVGGQGEHGSKLKGSKVSNVNNPRGIQPTKIGGGMGSMVRGPRQGKVGK
jgi:hypothetical protein